MQSEAAGPQGVEHSGTAVAAQSVEPDELTLNGQTATNELMTDGTPNQSLALRSNEVLDEIWDELDAGDEDWQADWVSLGRTAKRFAEPARRRIVRSIKWPCSAPGRQSLLDFLIAHPHCGPLIHKLDVSDCYTDRSGPECNDRFPVEPEQLAQALSTATGLGYLVLNLPVERIVSLRRTLETSSGLGKLSTLCIWSPPRQFEPDEPQTSEDEEDRLAAGICLDLIRRNSLTLEAIQIDGLRGAIRAEEVVSNAPLLQFIDVVKCQPQILVALLKLSSRSDIILRTRTPPEHLLPYAHRIHELGLPAFAEWELDDLQDFRQLRRFTGMIYLGGADFSVLPAQLETATFRLLTMSDLAALAEEIPRRAVFPALRCLAIGLWYHERNTPREEDRLHATHSETIARYRNSITESCRARNIECSFAKLSSFEIDFTG